MSKRPTELEAAALTSSWSVAQQAALYHIHLAQQAEKDEQEALKKKEEKEQKKMEEMARPEEVDAGEIVDGWINALCPPLYDFIDLLGPPHILISIFIVLHFVYWYLAPWYLHFLIPWMEIYFIPMYNSYRSIISGQDRVLWLSYWSILSVAEYFELLLFRDQTRSFIWWPKLKVLFCVTMYCIIENEDVLDSKARVKDKKPVYAAVKLFGKFLPKPSKKEKKEDKKDEKRKPK
ncbi:hypothetical protein I308_101696 [Cryptococcus tetragattii IND107]|uniref:Uncharacterized protein n=1 Tax=Cryptococcus tetragattii IND107 TaxID=1296105 RepID=A0ABR3BVH5_9TREE